jgi:hypothetical protein
MTRLLPVTLASLLIWAPTLAMAQSATRANPPVDSKPQKSFDIEVLRYFLSSSKAEKLLARCWHPAAEFLGTMRYRLILDDGGMVTTTMPFPANKGDGGVDEAARAAIASCAPYTIAATGRSWSITDVSFAGKGVAVIPLPHIPSERRKAPITPTDPLNLTQEEAGALRTQVARCVPPPPRGTSGRLQIDIDLILNFDGSVSPDSKIVASPTPELGQRVVKALVQCQPYLFPAEKYAAWKLIPMTVDLALPN